MTTLCNNNKYVNFDFGGQLAAWQIKSIFAENKTIAEKKEALSAAGWTESKISEFINFINSDNPQDLGMSLNCRKGVL